MSVLGRIVGSTRTRRATVAGAVLALGALAFPQSAAADSGIRVSPNGDCAGQWLSEPGGGRSEFRIEDRGNDNQRCYVDWAWNTAHDPTSRVYQGEDDFSWRYCPVTVRGTYIYFKVCEQQGGGPDNCTGWRVYNAW
jgi:hypothetical protein